MKNREQKRRRVGNSEGPAFLKTFSANPRSAEPVSATSIIAEMAVKSSPATHEAASETEHDPSTSVTSEPTKDPEKVNWQGWAEIENDPIIFNVMLREWGVRGIKVNEVVPLDAIFDTSPTSTYGLIFLSRYTSDKKSKQDIEIPNDLWFANQISTYSCATVALMNIVSNIENINLGQEVSQFITATGHMSSKDKGLALDSFEHVRRVHNSFATLIDMNSVDRRLREDAQAFANKRKRQASRKRTTKAKRGKKQHYRRNDLGDDADADADAAAIEEAEAEAETEAESEEDENGFHFTAYVPAHNHLWRMDGLQREPESLGVLLGDSGGANWLDMAVAELSARWLSAAENDIEFSLLSLVMAREDEGARVEEENARAERLREDWGPALAELVRVLAQRRCSSME